MSKSDFDNMLVRNEPGNAQEQFKKQTTGKHKKVRRINIGAENNKITIDVSCLRCSFCDASQNWADLQEVAGGGYICPDCLNGGL